MENVNVALLLNFLRLYDVNADAIALEKDFCNNSDIDESILLIKALKSFGFKTGAKSIKKDRLPFIPLPCFVRVQGQYHILLKADDAGILYADAGGNPHELGADDLDAQYDVILTTPRDVMATANRKFDISWFIPAVVKYKRLFGNVLIASFFIQVFALITPLFFQVVIDKVLLHGSLTTLHAIAVGLVGVALFDVVLSGLRTYLFSHTTSRIDVELGAKLYRHLLGLPLSYFSSRPVGQTVARVQELENIRDFLTGNALTAVLDFVFTFVFFAVMYMYSPLLTVIVLLTIPFYVVLSLFISPLLRAKAEEMFQRAARSQAFLVESTTGIETLKSMAVEGHMRTLWERMLSAYVKSSFRMNVLSMIGSNSVQFISKLMMVALLYFGAGLVISGELTVGALIAFNMLSGQVNAPIIRLAQLWQDFQQFKISLDRLGDVLNTPSESNYGIATASPPALKGAIEFDGVCFRYSAEQAEILRDISLHITAGQTIGIVGRSGSGKSTLTQMVQRLYVPERGKILIDGHDIALLNPEWLRTQIGVVLQENYLFNRTIRENIALANPSAPLDDVMHVSQLAGAHDFIMELPKGYDTILEERGTNLSGGQRQRIAIARALLTQPPILILDEATSALDYESEKIIQNNMKQICHGRTVLMIAHRLSTVRDADVIFVLDRGRIIECGDHDTLMAEQGLYAELHNNQAR